MNNTSRQRHALLKGTKDGNYIDIPAHYLTIANNGCQHKLPDFSCAPEKIDPSLFTESMITHLSAIYRQGNSHERTAVLIIFKHYAALVIDTIGAMLASEDVAVRIGTAQILGYLSHEKTFFFLNDAFHKEQDERAKNSIVEALGKTKDNRATTLLQNRIESTYLTDKEGAIVAICALMALPDETLLPLMKQLLHYAEFAPFAVQYIGLVGDASGLPPLFEILEHSTDYYFIRHVVSSIHKIEQSNNNDQEYQKTDVIQRYIDTRMSALHPELSLIICSAYKHECSDGQHILLWALDKLNHTLPLSFLNVVSSLNATHADQILHLIDPSGLDCSANGFLSAPLYEQKLIIYTTLYTRHTELIQLKDVICATHSSLKTAFAQWSQTAENPAAIDVLIYLLGDSNRAVSHAANQTLLHLYKTDEIIHKLTAAMADAPQQTKAYIMGILSTCKNASLIECLKPYINDNSELLQIAAVSSLSRLHQSQPGGNASDDELYDVLTRLLKHKNVSIRCIAIETLTLMFGNKPEVLDILEELLQKADEKIQFHIIQGLRYIQNDRVITIARNYMNNSMKRSVLISIAELFFDYNTAESIEGLIQLQECPDPYVQGVVATLLSKLNHTVSLDWIRKRCYSCNWFLKTSAIRALANFADPSVEHIFGELLENAHQKPDEIGYTVIMTTIEAFGQNTCCRRIEIMLPFLQYPLYRAHIFHALLQKGTLLMPRIDELATHKDPNIRRMTAVLLGSDEYRPALNRLIQLREDLLPSIRRTALISLSQIKSKAAIDAIKKILYDNTIDDLERFIIQEMTES